jgi:predicted nucleic acid-binding protein
MSVLETDVLYETMKPETNPIVRAWLNEQVVETLDLTSVTLAEMVFGIAVLPAGRRRNSLTRAFYGALELFNDRVLPFDANDARHSSALVVAARNAGLGCPTPDGYIAAIAASRDFIVASRDTSPYKAGRLWLSIPGKADAAGNNWSRAWNYGSVPQAAALKVRGIPARGT